MPFKLSEAQIYFQIDLTKKHTSLVVSPLVALMRTQVSYLRSCGISAAMHASEEHMGPSEKQGTYFLGKNF